MKNQSTFYIINRDAHLFDPNENNNQTPTLRKFLSRGKINFKRNMTIYGWFANLIGLEKQNDWPLGSIFASAYNNYKREIKYWLCCIPVRLTVENDGLAISLLNKADTIRNNQCFEKIYTHLSKENLEILQIGKALWCIGSQEHQNDLQCWDPYEIAGNIFEKLPRGQKSAYWKRLMTEIQMLLHETSLNCTDTDSEPNLPNSVWFFGGGKPVQPVDSQFTIASNDEFLMELAKASKSSTIALRENLQNTIISSDQQQYIINVDTNSKKTKSYLAWEHDWLLQAEKALLRKEIDRIVLVWAKYSDILEIEVTRSNIWQIWKTYDKAFKTLVDTE